MGINKWWLSVNAFTSSVSDLHNNQKQITLHHCMCGWEEGVRMRWYEEKKEEAHEKIEKEKKWQKEREEDEEEEEEEAQKAEKERRQKKWLPLYRSSGVWKHTLHSCRLAA